MSDYIPDLCYPILRFLSVKNLLRLRCVCKLWKEVIDSKSFVLDHLAVQKPRMIVHNKQLKYIHFDPNTLPSISELSGPIGLQIVEDTNQRHDLPRLYELVVVSTVAGVICLFDHRNLLVLWNPSIRRFFRIPIFESPIRSRSDLIDYRLTQCCGFWIDPSDSSFKIVVFCFALNKIVVFSSRQRAWTEMAMVTGVIRKKYLACLRNTQILIQGVGYWMTYDRKSGQEEVISFDFVQDKFKSIKCPELEDYDDLGDYSRTVLKWRELVSIAHWPESNPSLCFLWAMQNGSWSKMFRIQLFPMVDDVLFIDEHYGRLLAKSQGRSLVFCDRQAGEIHLESEFIGATSVVFAYNFVESFVFPDESCIPRL